MGNACRKAQPSRTVPSLKDLFEACEERPVPRVERVEPIVRSNPHLAQQRGKRACVAYSGRYPLYVALSNNASIDVITCLVAAWPNSVKASPFSGTVPLHVASASSSLDVVRFLVHQWPDSVRKQSTSGSLPLHWAIDSGRLDVVEFLVAQWKGALKVQDDKGLPLHRAMLQLPLKSSLALDMVKYLAVAWPGAIRVPCKRTGCSPLLLALMKFGHHNEEVAACSAKVLLEALPEAARDRSHGGIWMIHQAARFGSTCMIRLLCKVWPEGVKQVGPNGNLPLHYYLMHCRKKPDAGCLKLLVDLYPQSLTHMNDEGKVPIQVLRFDGATKEKLELLLHLIDRRRPLHFICTNERSIRRHEEGVDTTRLLIDIHAYAAKQVDKNGFLPWQLASTTNCDVSLALVYDLLRLCPDTLPR